MNICANPEDCCRELTRVWEALGNPKYDGRSCHEHVSALLTSEGEALAQIRKACSVAADADVKTICNVISAIRFELASEGEEIAPSSDVFRSELRENLAVVVAATLEIVALRAERDDLKAAHAKLRASAWSLLTDANRLCDRNQGGTYEEDCRLSIKLVRAALDAEKGQ